MAKAMVIKMDNTVHIPGEVPEGYSATGYLIVRVYTARGGIPVPGALVTISYADASEPAPHAVLTTDSSGRTPTISLPAPPRSLSLEPSDTSVYPRVLPYALYNIEIAREGFYKINDIGVRVFADITAIQDADLVPRAESLPQSYYRDDSQYVDQSEEDEL